MEDGGWPRYFQARPGSNATHYYPPWPDLSTWQMFSEMWTKHKHYASELRAACKGSCLHFRAATCVHLFRKNIEREEQDRNPSCQPHGTSEGCEKRGTVCSFLRKSLTAHSCSYALSPSSPKKASQAGASGRSRPTAGLPPTVTSTPPGQATQAEPDSRKSPQQQTGEWNLTVCVRGFPSLSLSFVLKAGSPGPTR